MNYRILNAEFMVMYTGGNSWMTLDHARSLVNYSKGEMIYEYLNGERLYEVF